MAINLRLSSFGNGTRNLFTGQGGGANLIYANALSPADGAAVSTRTLDRPASSTADYYLMDGLTDFRPWDLTQWGTPGNNIATAKGYRYLWLISCDHNGNGSGTEGGWAYDSALVYAAFSNDPHVFPEASTMRAIVPYTFTISGETGTFQGFQCWPVYNPDDATNPFYLYMEGGRQGGAFVNSLPMVMLKNSNFDSEFTPTSISHPTTSGGGFPGLTSFQRVYRLGTGNWVSWGGGNPALNDGSISKWTSTDGVTFTNGSTIKKRIDSTGALSTTFGWVKQFSFMGERFQIGSDWYVPCIEDTRGGSWFSTNSYLLNDIVSIGNITYKSLVGSNLNNPPASSPGQWQNIGIQGQYVTLVPVDGTTGDVIVGGPAFIRLSNQYAGLYPTSSYLQYVTSYIENGIVTCYALHGFFGDTGLISSALPEDGGGLNEQYIDVYSYVFDATAAKASAPLNVRASCNAGNVTLTWADLPAGRSYRIKRGTSFGTYGTTVTSSVAGTSITDSPTSGSVYYYQVISLDAGVEQASRVVSTYVS